MTHKYFLYFFVDFRALSTRMELEGGDKNQRTSKIIVFGQLQSILIIPLYKKKEVVHEQWVDRQYISGQKIAISRNLIYNGQELHICNAYFYIYCNWYTEKYYWQRMRYLPIQKLLCISKIFHSKLLCRFSRSNS